MDIAWRGALSPWTPCTSLSHSYIRRRSIYLGVHIAELPKIAGLLCLKNLSNCEWIFPGVVLEILGLARLCGSPAGVEEWIFLGVVLKLPGLDRLCGSPAGGNQSTVPVSGYFLE